MVFAILMMIFGALIYCSELEASNWQGVLWVCLNALLALADRLLQRLFLCKEQKGVDISIMGITLINSLFGAIPIGHFTMKVELRVGEKVWRRCYRGSFRSSREL